MCRIRPAWQIQACGPFFLQGWAIFTQKNILRAPKKRQIWSHQIACYQRADFMKYILIPIQNQGYMLTSITLDCIIAYCLLPFRQYKFVTSCVPHDSRYRHMGQFFLGSWAIFARKIFWQCPKKILIWPDQIACYQRAETDYIVGIRVSFKTVLPDSPRPIIVSIKNQTSGTSSHLTE